jgi:uncharacterized membrane protein
MFCPRSCRLIRTCVAVVLVGAFAISHLFAAPATFTGLGDLPHYDFESYATDVSADGSIVVGNSNGPYRWTRESGMIALPAMLSEARAITADGSKIIGSGYRGVDLDGPSEVITSWTEATGVVDLYVDYFWRYQFFASDVSADGQVVVGTNGSFDTPSAFQWFPTGLLNLGSTLDWGVESYAPAVSADGSVVVVSTGGSAARPENQPRSYVWTEATGLIDLGLASGFMGAHQATDITPDGRIIVGWRSTGIGSELFRWSEETGMVGIIDSSGQPTAVSSDGDTIVGSTYKHIYLESEYRWKVVQEAFVWTPHGGMENLQKKLISSGATGLDGWQLSEPTAISADGRTIVGNGINPFGQREAWIATLPVPEPSTVLLLLAATTGFCPRMFR